MVQTHHLRYEATCWSRVFAEHNTKGGSGNSVISNDLLTEGLSIAN